MQQVIEEFINDKKVAIIGASKNNKKWGNQLIIALQKKGYTVYPVNPNLNNSCVIFLS